MSILTYKIKHNKDFSKELRKAKQIANFALLTHSRSSKDVKHFGLPSSISNQILKKYSSKKIKKVSSVKLTIPNQAIRLIENTVKIPCLKLEFQHNIQKDFIKLNQIEIDNKYYYVSVEIKDKLEVISTKSIGVDRNTTGHCAVVAIPSTGKVIKLGKKAFHIHRKYKKIRENLQRANAKKMLKKIRRRESNIIKDINHKISKKIVEIAKENNYNIKLENLKGIRKNSKGGKNTKKGKNGERFKSSINTWEFYQLQTMIEYKSKICGIKVIYIDPRYTSQKCSKCGLIGNRNGKKFVCSNENCKHVDHADSNAAFNIANAAFELLNNTECNDQLSLDRDNDKGNTDIPKLETQLAKNESFWEVA